MGQGASRGSAVFASDRVPRSPSAVLPLMQRMLAAAVDVVKQRRRLQAEQMAEQAEQAKRRIETARRVRQETKRRQRREEEEEEAAARRKAAAAEQAARRGERSRPQVKQQGTPSPALLSWEEREAAALAVVQQIAALDLRGVNTQEVSPSPRQRRCCRSDGDEDATNPCGRHTCHVYLCLPRSGCMPACGVSPYGIFA